MESSLVSVESNIFDSTDIMLIIERLVDNGIISWKSYAGKKTCCLSEDFTKLKNTNKKVPRDIIHKIKDRTTKQEFASIKKQFLNLKLDMTMFLLDSIFPYIMW